MRRSGMTRLSRHVSKRSLIALVAPLVLSGTVGTVRSSLVSTAAQSASATSSTTPGWTVVVNDTFNSGGIPSHWDLYQATWVSSGHTPTAYYSPSHCTVSGGYLHLLMKYEPHGVPGNTAAAWYTCTASLAPGVETKPDVRVTLRWREVPSNGGLSHLNMPLRWPNNGCWPQGGEEDWFEGEPPAYNTATAFMHHGSNCSGGGNTQIYHRYGTINLTQFHTFRFQRMTSGSNVTVSAYADNLTTPVWTCSSTTSPACNTTTMPTTLKHTVLQQEVPFSACPDENDPQWNGSSCPKTTVASYTNGTLDAQVDWITVENPS